MKRNLHILFLSSWFPNRLEPASGNFIKRTAELVATKHQVTVLFFKGDATITEREVEKNVNGNYTEIIVYYPIKQHLFKKIAQLSNYKKAIDFGLKQLTSKADLIHANVAFPKGREFVYISKKLKLEYVLTELSSEFYAINRENWGKVKRQEIIRTLRSARVVLPTSEAVEKDLLEVEPMLTRFVVPLSVNPSIFYPKKKNKSNLFTFLHVSGLDKRYKNVEGIVEAFHALRAKNKNVALKIVTDSDPTSLWDSIQSKNIDDGVSILTNKTFEEIAQIYRESDCFVLFSNYETFSCVAAEALSSGIPLISTNVGIVKSLSDKLVVKVPIKNTGELLKAMEQVLNSTKKPDAQQLVKSVAFCHDENVLEQLSSIYNDVISTQVDA